MELSEFRKKVVDISGHYELIDNSTDYGDNGLDQYINQAQRALERKMNYGPVVAKYFKDIDVGTYLIQLTDCRVIKEVWILDTDGKSKLELLTEVKAGSIWNTKCYKYITTPFNQITAAKSAYYYPVNLRRYPDDETGSDDSATLQSYIDTVSPTNVTINGLVILPPTDTTYALEVKGIFYTPPLVEDDDTNYWTENHPDILLMATLRELDRFYRGTSSASKWNTYMGDSLMDLEKDSVEQDNSESTEMEG